MASTPSSLIHDVAPGVGYLRTLMVNVFFLHDPQQPDGSWVLVDAGLGGYASAIRTAAERRFGRRAPTAIVLTHGHFDHVGSLYRLQRMWPVPIYAHPTEMPHLSGQLSYPPPDPRVGGGLMAWAAPLYPRGPIDVGSSLRALLMYVLKTWPFRLGGRMLAARRGSHVDLDSSKVPPRVKQRLHVVAYALGHGMKPAGRHFGLDRKTVRDWVQRWKAGGERHSLKANCRCRPEGARHCCRVEAWLSARLGRDSPVLRAT